MGGDEEVNIGSITHRGTKSALCGHTQKMPRGRYRSYAQSVLLSFNTVELIANVDQEDYFSKPYEPI